MDIFMLLFSLLIIMGLIVGATIVINALMRGKFINLLLNRTLFIKVTSILAILFTFAFMVNDIEYGWGDLFWFAYSIALIFIVAYYIPTLISCLMDVHQNNLKDIKKQDLKRI